ncbi:hypothetical protein [Arthrobacter sp. H41]|uniref:hypothetical protein n=1 Tax=Arthrobacter sp. H41 TaxID=1312978 RepID=UPI00047E7FA2|nr:hypothetical protein [Arthrobacter sp. H41]
MASGKNEEGWAFSDEEAVREAGLSAPNISTEPEAVQDPTDPDVADTTDEYPSQPDTGKPSSDQSEPRGYQNDADPPR